MKAGNIQVRSEEMRLLDVGLRQHITMSRKASRDIEKYSSLSEAEALGTLPSLDATEELLRVVLEITKGTTPLVRKDIFWPKPSEDDPEPEPVVKFIEIDADGKDGMDGDNPKIAFDPKALEWETKAAVL